jgi:hypothetical protein
MAHAAKSGDNEPQLLQPVQRHQLRQKSSLSFLLLLLKETIISIITARNFDPE